MMARVAVRVLGCGDAFASGGRLQTCFFLDADPDRLLIDCGASALVGMRRFGVDPGAIDAVLLSHLHGDHFAGVPFLLLEAQFVSLRTRRLVLAGPVGTRERVLRALEVLFPGSSKLAWRFPLEFVELEAGRAGRFGAVSVLPFEVTHPSGAPAFALRLTCGDQVIAYSGDTAWTETLPEIARDADLLILECFAYAPLATYHLDFQTVRARRGDLRARRTVLTHMSQGMLEHLDHAERIGVETAHDGMLLELSDGRGPLGC
ncbi:MAG TPA: MBL fold metallo-hydrolase [Geminicoccaceae bacterium]|nr:MBL fold metallo-hydrolase [Geminicoccaceae bacterium]